MVPFEFVLTSMFRLEGKTIHHTLTVENPGQEELRFGIGFHPAFNIPFDDCHTTEDYEFRFDQPESPVIIDAAAPWSAQRAVLLQVEEHGKDPADDELVLQRQLLHGRSAHQNAGDL